jgi:hypothetical protein
MGRDRAAPGAGGVVTAPLRRRTRLLWALARRVALAYLVGLTVLIGGGLLASAGTWAELCYWEVALIVLFVVVFFNFPEDNDGRLERAGFACGVGSVLLASVFAYSLWTARQEQVMQDRGVVETAIVVAEHPQYIYEDPDVGPGYWAYSYTLRTIAGRPIRPDLPTGTTRLALGSRITVLADPRGQMMPGQTTRVIPRAWWLAAACTGGTAAASLLVAVWAVPGVARRRGT